MENEPLFMVPLDSFPIQKQKEAPRAWLPAVLKIRDHLFT